MPSGWVSGLGQGAAISTLARAFQETADQQYLDSAFRAYRFMLKPVEEGGCLGRFCNGDPIVEEYPGLPERHPQVLNGAISAYFGLHDLARVTADQGIARDLDALIASLKCNLYRYHAQPLSRYNTLEESRATLMYHRMHIRQLRALAAIAREDYFDIVAEAFARQSESLRGMARAAIHLAPRRMDRPFRVQLVFAVIAALVWLAWGAAAIWVYPIEPSALTPFLIGGFVSVIGLASSVFRAAVAERLPALTPRHLLIAGSLMCALGAMLPALEFVR